VVLVVAAMAGNGGAQDRVSEYHVKAGFLFHFAELVEWPAGAAGGTQFTICVLGDDPFQGELESTLGGKAIASRPIRIVHLDHPQDAQTCQVLFISDSEDSRLPKIFKDLGKSAVMTVGETDDFVERGGMIRFTTEQDKVRFEINLKAADASGLKISSRLLLLATNVYGKQG
jgi:uncharacterized protein DUF4154